MTTYARSIMMEKRALTPERIEQDNRISRAFVAKGRRPPEFSSAEMSPYFNAKDTPHPLHGRFNTYGTPLNDPGISRDWKDAADFIEAKNTPGKPFLNAINSVYDTVASKFSGAPASPNPASPGASVGSPPQITAAPTQPTYYPPASPTYMHPAPTAQPSQPAPTAPPTYYPPSSPTYMRPAAASAPPQTPQPTTPAASTQPATSAPAPPMGSPAPGFTPPAGSIAANIKPSPAPAPNNIHAIQPAATGPRYNQPGQVSPDMNALFKKHHATNFDPHSSMDRAKMQQLNKQFGA